jgi:hypothetical protein
MSNFNFDLLGEMAENAPTAGFGPQVNYGKMTIQVDVVSWKDRQINVKSFDNKPLKQGEYIQLTFTSDLSEFNPALTNPYKRKVDMKKSGADKKSLTDWTEIVEKSLKATLGNDYWKKLGKGAYMEWEDVETVQLDKEGNKKGWNGKPDDEGKVKHYTNTVPRFLRVFRSKAECAAAREERFSKNGSSADTDVEAGEIPASIVNEARGLIKAMGVQQAREYLEQSPYDAYDIEELITAANPL